MIYLRIGARLGLKSLILSILVVSQLVSTDAFGKGNPLYYAGSDAVDDLISACNKMRVDKTLFLPETFKQKLSSLSSALDGRYSELTGLFKGISGIQEIKKNIQEFNDSIKILQQGKKLSAIDWNLAHYWFVLIFERVELERELDAKPKQKIRLSKQIADISNRINVFLNPGLFDGNSKSTILTHFKDLSDTLLLTTFPHACSLAIYSESGLGIVPISKAFVEHVYLLGAVEKTMTPDGIEARPLIFFAHDRGHAELDYEYRTFASTKKLYDEEVECSKNLFTSIETLPDGEKKEKLQFAFFYLIHEKYLSVSDLFNREPSSVLDIGPVALRFLNAKDMMPFLPKNVPVNLEEAEKHICSVDEAFCFHLKSCRSSTKEIQKEKVNLKLDKPNNSEQTQTQSEGPPKVNNSVDSAK